MRFILIDQSIKASAGHYLPYAESVLEEANKRGFETILVSNVAYNGTANGAYQLKKHFSYTSSESVSEYRIDFSKNKYRRVLKKRVLRSIKCILGEKYWLLRGLLKRHKFLDSSSRDLQYKADIFKKEFLEICLNLGLCKDEIVFLPTISVVELKGIITAFNNLDGKNIPRISVFFRNNIFYGERSDYLDEMPYHIYEKTTFALGKSLYEKGALRFFCDTNELAIQYKMISGYDFGVLPIPHTEYAGSEIIEENSKMTVSYLGDARHEKGYQYLPHIVKQTKDMNIGFCVQSNFNVDGGEAGIRQCRRILEKYKNVVVYRENLDKETYEKVLSNTDIMLLLYDSKQYYARSSGVFAEAVSMKIPTIISAGTWMSREACRGQNEIIKKIINDRKIEMQDARFEVNKFVIESNYARQIICRLEFSDDTEQGSFFVKIFHKNDGKTYRKDRLYLEKTEGKFVYFFVGKMQSDDEMEIRVHTLNKELIFRILKLQIGFDENVSAQVSSFIIVKRQREYVNALQNMVSNYSNYMIAAERFSEIWIKTHNAANLLEILEN